MAGFVRKMAAMRFEQVQRFILAKKYFGVGGTLTCIIYIYIYIYIERKQSKHTRQRSAVATLSFTPVGDLQATGSSNLLQAHINKGDI